MNGHGKDSEVEIAGCEEVWDETEECAREGVPDPDRVV